MYNFKKRSMFSDVSDDLFTFSKSFSLLKLHSTSALFTVNIATRHLSRCPNGDSTLSNTYDRTLNNNGNAARTVKSSVNSTVNDPKGPNTDRTDNLPKHANQVFPESDLNDISTDQDILFPMKIKTNKVVMGTKGQKEQ
ncbi:hypothetical protein GJ496_008552 [Pomphorhynchus laevis]|nr:hypothetical protein GJ496_008552 [Pomphorhynchus laevis]